MSKVKKIIPISSKEKTQFLLIVSMLGYDRLTINAKKVGDREIYIYKFDKTKMEDDLVSHTPHFEYKDGQSFEATKLSLRLLFELIDRKTIKTQRKLKSDSTKDIAEIVSYEATHDYSKFNISELFEAMLFSQEKFGVSKQKFKTMRENTEKLRFLEQDDVVLDWFSSSLDKTKIVDKEIKL